jgi:hypothetical protein
MEGFRTPEGNKQLRRVGVDGKIILKRISKKYGLWIQLDIFGSRWRQWWDIAKQQIVHVP